MSSLPLYTPAASNSMHINKEKLHSIRETSSKKMLRVKKVKSMTIRHIFWLQFLEFFLTKAQDYGGKGQY